MLGRRLVWLNGIYSSFSCRRCRHRHGGSVPAASCTLTVVRADAWPAVPAGAAQHCVRAHRQCLMKPQVIIIGTGHRLQAGHSQYSSDQHKDFRQLLADTCKKYRIKLIAEEMAADVVADFGTTG